MSATRSETSLAADVVWVLILSGVIDRKRWTAHQLANTVGCTVEELESSKRRCEREGFDALLPRGPGSFSERHEYGTRPPPRPGERRCRRCDEWLPEEKFRARGPNDPRPGPMCEICAGEHERDLYVAVRKAAALREVVAFVTAARNDACVGMRCPNCEQSIEVGDHVKIQGVPAHTKCRKGNR